MSSDHDSQGQGSVVAGALALIGALIAVVWANVDLGSYQHAQHLSIGPLSLEQWAADGGLTLFFFVAGLELKRELVGGALSDPKVAAIPVAAAACGVALPALVFVGLSLGTPNLRGWAIPSPTDIAFALAVLAILGNRVSSSLRVFLLTLAVVDDVIVIVIIALAYSGSLHTGWLLGAVALVCLYSLATRLRFPFWLLGSLAISGWWCTLHSGIHATVAGVALALLTPVNERLEHQLTPWSDRVAVPLFALMSAGVSVSGSGLFDARIFWAVAAGLLVGKPLGIVLGSVIASRLTRAPWDGDKGSLRDLVGLGLLGGIGFTVALLVSDLAFADERQTQAKAAVLAASTVAATLGALILTIGRAHADTR